MAQEACALLQGTDDRHERIYPDVIAHNFDDVEFISFTAKAGRMMIPADTSRLLICDEQLGEEG
jgi:hypothetical protein